jgi:hypothetical protein
LFFGLPSAYLTYRRPHLFKAALIPALIIGFFYSLSFEYLGEVGNAWIFPRPEIFIFDKFFFGLVPLDVMMWYVLWAFLIVSYYEYFVDAPKCRYSLRRIGFALLLGTPPLLAIVVAKYIFGTDISIPYPYLVLGLLALFPAAVLYGKNPKIFHKLFLVFPYLFLVFFTMELVALAHHYWAFTGDYIYTFNILGSTVPLEEIFFWIIASPLIIPAYYELLLDDSK